MQFHRFEPFCHPQWENQLANERKALNFQGIFVFLTSTVFLWFGIFYHRPDWNQDFTKPFPSGQDQWERINSILLELIAHFQLILIAELNPSFTLLIFTNNTTKAKQKSLYKPLLNKKGFPCLT